MIMVGKDKAYIVANEQQEREVLDKLEQEGMVWGIINEKPTDFAPSVYYIVSFPYVIIVNNWISWNWLSNLKNEEIVYDGRKMEEEHMSEKYVVSQEFMNTLVKWKDEHETELEVSLTKLIDPHEVTYLATIVDDWWLDSNMSNIEQNNRLIAITRWVNGEDVFEIEKPKKWVVQSKKVNEDGEYRYVFVENDIVGDPENYWGATRFDTKEEAESWANAHQEVIEVEE